jgi:hypothetical protein
MVRHEDKVTVRKSQERSVHPVSFRLLFVCVGQDCETRKVAENYLMKLLGYSNNTAHGCYDCETTSFKLPTHTKEEKVTTA